MSRARVYKRLRRPNGALVTGSVGRRLGGNRTDVEVVVRNAKPLRAKFVFPDGFTGKDKYGNYTTLRNAPGDSVYALSFPFGPQDLKFDQFSPRFQELERPFKKPLLVSNSSSLRTVSFNAVIADRESGGKLSVIDFLDRLEAIADSGAAFQFTYGLTALPFSVALTKFSYVVTYRSLEGAPIRAEVSIQLTESVFADQDLIILKAVHRSPSPAVTPSIPSSPSRGTTQRPPVVVEEDPGVINVTINPSDGSVIQHPTAGDASAVMGG